MRKLITTLLIATSTSVSANKQDNYVLVEGNSEITIDRSGYTITYDPRKEWFLDENFKGELKAYSPSITKKGKYGKSQFFRKTDSKGMDASWYLSASMNIYVQYYQGFPGCGEVKEKTTLDVNGQLVNFACKCSDENDFVVLVPITQKGADYMYSEFSEKEHVTIADIPFTAKGFRKAINKQLSIL